MSYEIILNRNGYKQAVKVIAGTFKKWKVWNITLHSGEQAMLFKCGHTWLQRYSDKLDTILLTAIGERIDQITRGLTLS
ncbi:MAG: hypothetical protein ABI203_02050 [Mucilaginibacter sp.]